MTSPYDAAGRLTGREDPLGNRITFTYDAAGRRAAWYDVLGANGEHEQPAGYGDRASSGAVSAGSAREQDDLRV